MNPWSLLATLIFSLVGLVYLKQGKAAADPVRMICGAALMVYPYFTGGILWVLLIGAALTSLPFAMKRF